MASSTARAFTPNSSRPKILILGAGMAGLSAARALHDSGLFEVTVLEARQRLGGRICTLTDSQGYIREEGAGWIHGEEGNPLVDLCAAYGIETVLADNWSDISTFDPAGPMPPERRKAYDELYRKLIADLHMDKQSLKEKVPSEGLSGDISLRAALDKQLRRITNPVERNFLEHLFKVNLEDDYGTDLDKISLLNWNGEKDYAHPDRMIPRGYGVLIDKIAAGLNVILNTAASSVDHSGEKIKVSTRDGRTFEADQIIVTLPLGVLKKQGLRFWPELPSWKKEAIARVGYGTFSKVFITYARSFWPETASWLESVRGKLPHIASFFNLQKFGGGTALVGLASGRSSDHLQGLPAAEVKSWAEESLALVSHDLPPATEIYRTTWSQDPWAEGAYSFPAVNESRTDRDLIGASVGAKLHFAGEACQADFYGTVHAAWISGQRVAERILNPPVV